jgi:putative phage-type endonuclease
VRCGTGEEAVSHDEFTVETCPDRESWLQGRSGSVGASDAAAVVGLSTYQSAYGLWIDKTELFRMEELDELAEWGLILEPVICQEFARRSNVRTHLCQPFSFYRSRERHHVTASVDAIAEGYPPIPVQLKTAHFQAGKVWQKEVPLAYLCQLQTEIYVTGAAYGYIAVLIDGYQFRWHKVPRHQAFIDRLLKRIDHFWNEHVIKRVPPPTDYHEATTKALLRKYPTSTGTVVELPDELEPLYEEMKTLTAAESAASRRKEEIKNHVRERMGNARYGYLPNGKGFQWSGENGTRRFTLTERCPEPASR